MDEQFQTTSWSVIAAAKGAASSAGRDALEALCRQYWQPLYTYVRLKGHAPDAAQDLTQEFFAHLLARDFLENVDEARGRFRAFLLACMNNFLANEWRKGKAEKRGGEASAFSLDFALVEEQYALQEGDAPDPRMAFDRHWAETLMDGALRQLKAEYAREGKAENFEVLNGYLGQTVKPPSYAEAAAQLEISEGAARVTVHRLRRRFAALVRRKIAETVENADEIQEELDYLIEVMSA